LGHFLDRYIFPGGYLPTVHLLLLSIHDGSKGQLEVESVQSIGPHYIKTLQCWRENFERNWEESIRADFWEKNGGNATELQTEAFRRKWVASWLPSSFPLHVIDFHNVADISDD
jgi:cyclopropane-fatty-acyl-phospholipid synthase